MADILVQHHGENKTAAMELQSPDSQAAPLSIAMYYTLGFPFGTMRIWKAMLFY